MVPVDITFEICRKVYLARKIRTGDIYAIKILDKKAMIHKNMVEHVRVERDIMANTHNPFVVKLYYAFQSEVSHNTTITA
jgi:serine/threonine protein kinase